MNDSDFDRIDWFVVYLKGVCMGAADAVPGVSGGTIALLTGIYERLIAAVTAVSIGRILSVLSGVRPGHRARAREAFAEMDGSFLVVLVSGIFTAVVVLTRVFAVAIDEFPVPTFGLFFGLIAASSIVLYRDVTFDTPGRVAAAITGFVVAFALSGRAAAALGSGAVVTVVAGAIAISAMVLPGVSGSLLLVVLGQYERMVDTLRTFIDGLLGVLVGNGTAGLVDPATTVFLFVGGAFVGLFTIAHVVRWALDHHHEATLAFLVSLVVGALRAPVVTADEKLVASGGAWTAETLLVFGVAAVVGGALVATLERYTDGVEY